MGRKVGGGGLLVEERLRLIVWGLAVGWLPIIAWTGFPSSGARTRALLDATWDATGVAALSAVVSVALLSVAVFAHRARWVRVGLAVAGCYWLFLALLLFFSGLPLAGGITAAVFLQTAVSYAVAPKDLP